MKPSLRESVLFIPVGDRVFVFAIYLDANLAGEFSSKASKKCTSCVDGENVCSRVGPGGKCLCVGDYFCCSGKKTEKAGRLAWYLNFSHVVRMFLKSRIEETEEVIYTADGYSFNKKQW